MKNKKWLLLLLLLVTGRFVSFGQVKDNFTTGKVQATGPAYNILRSLQGNWNVQMNIYPNAGAKPITSYMVAKRALSYHFLMETMTASPGSKMPPFNRTAYFNYNNANHRWEYIVLDSRYPLMMFETSRDTAQVSKGLTLYLSSFISPPSRDSAMSGKTASQRRTIEFVSPDKTIVKQYWTLPSKPEFLAIEYIYTRRK